MPVPHTCPDEPENNWAGYTVTHAIPRQGTALTQEAVSEQGHRAMVKALCPHAPRAAHAAMDNEEAILRFLNEQDGTPLLIESGTRSGWRYLITEHRPGPTLGLLLEGSRLLMQRPSAGSLAFAQSLALALCHGYARLHSRGVAHGDVHPGNILVGSEHHVTIIDFESAARIDDAPMGYCSQITIYTAPEIALALREQVSLPTATPASDQYSVAAVLYLMLSGTYAVPPQKTEPDMLEAITGTVPAPLPGWLPLQWPGLQRALSTALHLDPGQRHASMIAFARALAPGDPHHAQDAEPAGMARTEQNADAHSGR
ncbi:phosphotransferase [Streptomyces sp. UNOB3_S3]|nr:phosphotransferase [Streptomyces sp. UNOB3_S3]